ncbi:MAG: hypothetical protein ACK5QQ_14140 [Cyanobacteriota bacterium]
MSSDWQAAWAWAATRIPADPRRIKPDLIGLVPQQERENLSIRLLFHGRAICQTRQPACPTCPLAVLCSSHPGR